MLNFVQIAHFILVSKLFFANMILARRFFTIINSPFRHYRGGVRSTGRGGGPSLGILGKCMGEIRRVMTMQVVRSPSLFLFKKKALLAKSKPKKLNPF